MCIGTNPQLFGSSSNPHFLRKHFIVGLLLLAGILAAFVIIWGGIHPPRPIGDVWNMAQLGQAIEQNKVKRLIVYDTTVIVEIPNSSAAVVYKTAGESINQSLANLGISAELLKHTKIVVYPSIHLSFALSSCLIPILAIGSGLWFVRNRHSLAK